VEALFGEALAMQPGLRAKLQLVSKCGIKLISPARPEHRIKSYDASPAHVRASVEASLRALHTDHLDLLLIHRPDLLLDADALADCFAQLQREGKVLHFGASNFSTHQFELLHSRFPLVTNQIEFSPLQLSALTDGTLDQAQRLRLRPMLWSPLGGGRLFSGGDAQALAVRGALEAVAHTRGISLTTAALAWLLRHPSRPLPVIGTRRLDAAEEALAATRITLSPDEWYAVLQASRGKEVA
jgi:predicted oxidoreductase